MSKQTESATNACTASGQTGELVYIDVSLIHSHPDNPRKNLGDLSELAESIKVNGILQNLTVVPMTSATSGRGYCPSCALYLPSSPTMCKDDHKDRAPCKHWRDAGRYTVVIGHRRLAAAKLAGVEKLPCIVSNMDRAEQVRTMLMENIQREDLTVYEQAQGFQMMLDMGDTVEDIAWKSGFSQTTVRRRVKLLALDQDKFKASVDRGATLQDYMELDKVEDLALKNEVLEHVGTNNFRSKLQQAIDREKTQKYLTEIAKELSVFAVEITERNGDMKYVDYYAYWNKNKKVEQPDDADIVKYYYKIGTQQVDLYRERTEEQADAKAEEQRAHVQAELERRKEGLREATARAFRLRNDFVFNHSTAKKYIPQILKAAGHLCFTADNCWLDLNYELLAELLGIDYDCENDEFPMDTYDEKMAERPEYALLATLVASVDEENNGYWGMSWRTDFQASVPVLTENKSLDDLYAFLQKLGYELSEEEKALQNGTHELFRRDESDKDDEKKADPCTLCKAAHPFCDECCATCEDHCNSGQICRKQTEDYGE